MFNGWKTLIFSAVVALVGVAQQADWIHLVGSQNAGTVITVIGVLGGILRLVTTGPIAPLK